VARSERVRLVEQRAERGPQLVRVERASARVILLRDLADRPRRRERHSRARGLMPDRAPDAACQRAEQPAQHLASVLLQILSRQTYAERRDEILDVPLVELVAVRLADPKDEPH